MSASYLASASGVTTGRRFPSLSLSSVTALTIRIFGAGGLFLSHLLLVRALGTTGFGEYAEAVAWLQVLCVVGKFGFDNASLRYVSEYSTKGELSKLHSFRRISLRVSLIASFVAMLILILSAILGWNSIGPRLACCILIAAIMVPLISIRQIQESSLRGIGRLIESQVSTAVWPTTLFLLAGIVWIIAPHDLSSPVAMFLHLVSVGGVSVMVYHFLTRSNLNALPRLIEDEYQSIWIKSATTFLLAELLIGLKSRICILMAGRILGSDSAGIYAAMDRFAEVSVLGSQSLGFVIAPQFASLFAAGRYTEMRRLMRHGSLLSLAFTFPVAIGILCFSDLIFQLLGASYRQGWYLLLSLLISMCISVLAGPSAYVLQMTGREKTMLYITSICAATNILSGLLLIGSMGIEGLGLAQIMTSCVWAVGVRVCLARHPAWNNPDVITVPIASHGSQSEAS